MNKQNIGEMKAQILKEKLKKYLNARIQESGIKNGYYSKIKNDIVKINLLEENECELKCKCGWNIWIGGKDIKDLKKIKDFLKTLK